MPRASSEWEIDLFIDLATNLFGHPGDPTPDVRARNVNTIDEVPDSSWFTNRILARPLTPDDAVTRSAHRQRAGAGPLERGVAEARRLRAGIHDARLARRSAGSCPSTPAGHPEAATGAIVVANKIFWALGYWQVENYLVAVSRDQIVVADTAAFTPASGRERRMQARDLDDVLQRAHRSADGTLPRHRRPRRARPSDRRVPLLRHAPRRSRTTSSRTSTGASCGR